MTATDLLTRGNLSIPRRGSPNNLNELKNIWQTLGYRAYKNRAIIYALIETGMRRGAVCRLDVDDLDARRRSVTVREKGAALHRYQIIKEGLDAIRDYIKHKREGKGKGK